MNSAILDFLSYEKIEYIENGTADASYYETVEKDINELLGIIQFLLISKLSFGYLLTCSTYFQNVFCM